MYDKPSPEVQSISDTIANLHKIEALAHAIENLTDELHSFDSYSPTFERLSKDRSNMIYQLAGVLRDLTKQAIDISLKTQECIRKSGIA